jgi:hypothetical protein
VQLSYSQAEEDRIRLRSELERLRLSGISSDRTVAENAKSQLFTMEMDLIKLREDYNLTKHQLIKADTKIADLESQLQI